MPFRVTLPKPLLKCLDLRNKVDVFTDLTQLSARGLPASSIPSERDLTHSISRADCKSRHRHRLRLRLQSAFPRYYPMRPRRPLDCSAGGCFSPLSTRPRGKRRGRKRKKPQKAPFPDSHRRLEIFDIRSLENA
jgi:hypothetical protein